MAILSKDKIKKGKQSSFVNENVKEFDSDLYGETNLFGERIEDSIPDKFPHLVQLGNLRTNRTKFTNPHQTRIYSPKGTCPTLTITLSPRFLIEDDGEYKTRVLNGFESMRLMGVDDEDIQKLVDGGISNNQLCQLAGNSIVVDVMSELFKELIKH